MVEKFSDYEGAKYLASEGSFVFTVKTYELKDSSKGTPMAVFEVESDEGQSTIYHSLNPKARWSYNGLIKACLNLTAEQAKTFELDYETIGKDLIGTKFVGTVEKDVYQKQIKVPKDDGTFEDGVEEKTTYRITKYEAL